MNLDRREFIKMIRLLAASSIIPSLDLEPTSQGGDSDTENIIIFVFDAWSAKNVPFYGYPRQTMPQLARILEHATVFHHHYSGANFTTSGTASLLTGTYPWTHRALKMNDEVAPDFISRNIFSLFEKYHRVAYTHNPIADTLLNQFNQDINFHKFREELLVKSNWWIDELFNRDFDTASLSWTRASDPDIDGLVYSLLFSENANKLLNKIPPELEMLFPRGLPGYKNNPLILEHAIEWLQRQVKEFKNPYLMYFHMWPPHAPYRTRGEYVDTFLDDDVTPLVKDFHHLTPNAKTPGETLLRKRQIYDEYILYVDAEFARFYTFMENEGLLENTWIILTSDHGEMFERGNFGHATPHLYQPLVHIPLIIFEPGKKSRNDIYTPTSCTDILPTLLQITGQTIPAWIEGNVLPPFQFVNSARAPSVFSFHGKLIQDKYGELVNGTMVMVKDNMKAIRYFGYTDAYGYPIEMLSDPWYEVYDLSNDPEEINNLMILNPSSAKDLIDEMEQKFQEIKGPHIG